MILAKVFEDNPIRGIFISELIFFPGLSYISFRLLSVYLDSNNQTASINIVSFGFKLKRLIDDQRSQKVTKS